ncbi:hypothetical protein [Maledivibacter halophilus]|uniref:Uncharacterized protein n=1 Tax=Maledivibacter halophilus TaxID=36842 RepID=A0A1T5IH28_9FIRM|nr:hypothetical protein [Maledivibacter halophilus]SKC38368.1 hypothetical protein SAMN02194393_00365 [Maledivibacter halophilus]
MGLTIQQFFDYVNGMTESRPGVILKGKKDNNEIYYRIHTAHDKFFIDTIKNIDDEKNIENRYITDKEELQNFKVKIMELLKLIEVKDIYLE